MTKKSTSSLLVITLLGSLVFIGAACTRSRTDGGVFFSNDGGSTWTQRVALEQQENSQPGTIANYDITSLTIDPTNPQRLYAGTWNNGAIISEDGGEHWKPFLRNRGTVRAVLVNPRDARMLYAALPNQIIRSENTGNDWKEVLPVSGSDVAVQSMTLGGNDGRVLYVGLTNGDLLRSDARGESWTRMHTFDSRIERVLANENDASIVYIATARQALWRSADGGKSWTKFLNHATWESMDGARSYRALALDRSTFDGVLYVSQGGILRTRDGGLTWSTIGALESAGNVTISAIATHPRDTNTLIYGNRQGIFRTTDGGGAWKTLSLDSSRAPMSIVFSQQNPTQVYVGLAK